MNHSSKARRAALIGSHADLAGQLAETFTEAELTDLAQRLPEDRDAATLLIKSIDTADRARYLKFCAAAAGADDAKHRAYLATYVAAAAQHGAAKVLTELLALAERKRAMLADLAAILGDHGARCPMLAEAIKKGG